jgi:predicted MPP superfamily phosphohydrolase
MGKRILVLIFCSISLFSSAQNLQKPPVVEIVFTSDAHYGIQRKEFRGDSSVTAQKVNEAMIRKINGLIGTKLPQDGGVAAGRTIDYIDYVVEGGDIANRMEIPIQSAKKSWRQFDSDYVEGIHLKNHLGLPAKLFIIPGNHDISNAIGFYKPMKPAKDPTPMVQIYNRMIHPSVLKTNSTYQYSSGKINYSRDINGVYLMFITLWPDSLERVWMDKDLKEIPVSEPVIIFTHDEPVCEAKHFTDPNPGHTINARDRFENLLAEVYKDSTAIGADGGKTTLEQKRWVAFLKRHPNIRAYFHGNTNFNEFYDYRGPDSTVDLPTFRVDSPMKGRFSKIDETKLSFIVISLDTQLDKLTARECLWNTDPRHPDKPVQWGTTRTISLRNSSRQISIK